LLLHYIVDRDILLIPTDEDSGMLVVDLADPSRQCRARSLEGLSPLDLYFYIFVNYLEDDDVVKGCFENDCSRYNKDTDYWDEDNSSDMAYRE